MEHKSDNLCPFCKKEIAEGEKFCHHCGAQQDIFINIKCKKCGTAIEGNQKFCSKCGAKINTINFTWINSLINKVKIFFLDKKNEKKKRIIFASTIIIFALLISITSILINTSKADFNKIYIKYCSSQWATLGANNDLLFITVKESDEQDNTFQTYDAIKKIHKDLKLPDSLIDEIFMTTNSIGIQNKEFKKQNIIVIWDSNQVSYAKIQ